MILAADPLLASTWSPVALQSLTVSLLLRRDLSFFTLSLAL